MKKKIRKEDVKNWGKRGFDQGGGQGSSESGYEGREENMKNRGYEEDQPEHPIRASKSTPKAQRGKNTSNRTYDDKTT